MLRVRGLSGWVGRDPEVWLAETRGKVGEGGMCGGGKGFDGSLRFQNYISEEWQLS